MMQMNDIRKYILVTILTILTILTNQKIQKFERNSSNDIISKEINTFTNSQIMYKKAKKDVMHIELPVKYICQYPELPTGCEATALTMVLNYYGFDIDKETIADKYMEKQNYPGDFYNYFVGDPFTNTGLGIYAPGLVNTANAYLEMVNTEMEAYDISGVSISEICNHVEKGHPVCIWTTYDIDRDPVVTSKWTIKGKEYRWKKNEHCMVVIGFDKEKDTLIIANPASGITEYSREIIEKRNDQFDRMAMIIK